MAEIRTVTTLRAKRDEIQSAIGLYERKLAQARADLSAIAAAIRIFEASGQALDISSYTDLHRLFRRGESTAIARAALEKNGPMTTTDLALAVMAAKGLDTSDTILRKAVALRLVHALIMQHRAGKLLDGGKAKGGVRIWALP